MSFELGLVNYEKSTSLIMINVERLLFNEIDSIHTTYALFSEKFEAVAATFYCFVNIINGLCCCKIR